MPPPTLWLDPESAPACSPRPCRPTLPFALVLSLAPALLPWGTARHLFYAELAQPLVQADAPTGTPLS
eukprot:13865124-Alexandrium_andersonii.AAC.1